MIVQVTNTTGTLGMRVIAEISSVQHSTNTSNSYIDILYGTTRFARHTTGNGFNDDFRYVIVAAVQCFCFFIIIFIIFIYYII